MLERFDALSFYPELVLFTEPYSAHFCLINPLSEGTQKGSNTFRLVQSDFYPTFLMIRL